MLSTILISIGVLFNLFGCIGLIRLPDVYNRLQSATKCVTLGTCSILAGVAVHFGLIVTLNLGIGQQTPPVASVLITACSVAKADIWEVSRVNVAFVAVIVAVLLLITYVPVIPMSLVRLFYG